jgi:DNA polymerase/3'-5' exonuclease PolX
VKTPWSGALLEPEVLARLAEAPPGDAASLAAVPGVGPELVARVGGRILEALGVSGPVPVLASTPGVEDAPFRNALADWRRERAAAEGVQAWQVLTDAALEALSAAVPADLPALAALCGLGPRALAGYGAELLALRRALASGAAEGDRT